MSASFIAGQTVYALHLIIGTEVGRGTQLTIVEPVDAWTSKEPYYLVRTPNGFKVYAFESDLSARFPHDD